MRRGGVCCAERRCGVVVRRSCGWWVRPGCVVFQQGRQNFHKVGLRQRRCSHCRPSNAFVEGSLHTYWHAPGHRHTHFCGGVVFRCRSDDYLLSLCRFVWFWDHVVCTCRDCGDSSQVLDCARLQLQVGTDVNSNEWFQQGSQYFPPWRSVGRAELDDQLGVWDRESAH